MSSLYADHKAVLGAQEKPILNRFHQKRVASTPLPRTFNQDVNFSAAPTKRKISILEKMLGLIQQVERIQNAFLIKNHYLTKMLNMKMIMCNFWKQVNDYALIILLIDVIKNFKQQLKEYLH